MQRSNTWIWLVLAALLLLAPGPAGRFLLDLLGGLTLVLLLLPLLLGAGGWLGWQVLRRRLRTCTACGFASLAQDQCPACGQPFAPVDGSGFPGDGLVDGLDVRNVTIDVQVLDVDPGVGTGTDREPGPAGERDSG